MKKYEKIYAFNVIDEIKKGEDVFLIDRARLDNHSAITKANKTSTERICEVLNHNNKDNRYEFFKVVETEEEANEE